MTPETTYLRCLPARSKSADIPFRQKNVGARGLGPFDPTTSGANDLFGPPREEHWRGLGVSLCAAFECGRTAVARTIGRESKTRPSRPLFDSETLAGADAVVVVPVARIVAVPVRGARVVGVVPVVAAAVHAVAGAKELSPFES